MHKAGVESFTEYSAWNSYLTAVLSPLLFSVLTSTTLQRTERGDRMWISLVRGAAALIIDHDSTKLLPPL